jgi:hypothetical protein
VSRFLTTLLPALVLGATGLDAQAPGGRSCASTAWSERHQAVVLFGGSATACGVAPIADGTLWGWNGSAWRRLALTGSPGAREDAHLLATPDGLLLIGGRREGTVFADAWRFDTAWHALTITGTPSPRLEHSAAAFDPVRGEVVRFGGGVAGAPGQLSRETTLLKGTTWSTRTDQFGPAARVGHALAWSPADRRVLLYGGFGPTGSFRDLWSWDGLAWQLVDSLGPSHIEGAVLVATDTGVVLIGAGLDAQPGQSLRAWRLHDKRWTPLAGQGPPMRIGQQLAFDHSRRVIVVLGGNLPDQRPTAEVWEYDFRAWRRVQ